MKVMKQIIRVFIVIIALFSQYILANEQEICVSYPAGAGFCLRPLPSGERKPAREEFNILDYYVGKFPASKGKIYHQTRVGVIWRIIEKSNGFMNRGAWFSGTLHDFTKGQKIGTKLIKAPDSQTPEFNLVFDAHRLNALGVNFSSGDPWLCADEPVPFAALTDESKREVLHALAGLPQGIYPMPSAEKLAAVFGFKSVHALELFLGDDAGVLTQANRGLRQELNNLILWDKEGTYKIPPTIDLIGSNFGHYERLGIGKTKSLLNRTFTAALNLEKSGIVSRMPSVPGIRVAPLTRLAVIFYCIGQAEARQNREEAPSLTAYIVRRDMRRLQFNPAEIDFVIGLISGGAIEMAIRFGKYPRGDDILRLQQAISAVGVKLNVSRQILEAI